MLFGRLGDIRVDDFWNPFFQKCRGASGDHENGLKTSKPPKINYLVLGFRVWGLGFRGLGFRV